MTVVGRNTVIVWSYMDIGKSFWLKRGCCCCCCRIEKRLGVYQDGRTGKRLRELGWAE
jgi:hypothetical protein